MARLARFALALGLLLAAVGCGSGPQQRRVTIMIPWSGGEFQAFYSVIKTFEAETRIRVNVEVTRALTQQLDAAVAAGAPPDLAMLPSVGAVDQYAQDHRLQPLDVGTTAYVQPFRGLATVKGTVYAVPVKADIKSLIWYDPAVTPARPPTAPAALKALSQANPRTWCLGLASGPTSGWPGADWIADLLLAEGDGTAYKQWLWGDLKWTARQVSDAWRTWRGLVGGSVGDASIRPFGAAAKGMISTPPTCSLDHGALSAMGFPAGLRPETNYDYVTSSPGHRLEVSADFVGMFTRNPSAAALITYLSGTEAQRAWVNEAEGYAFSANSEVTPSRYRNPVQGRIAAMLQPHSGYTLCFSAADAMTPDVSAAFYRAVLDYATDAETLSKLLAGLDAVQSQRGNSPVPHGNLCATPA